MIPCSPDVHTTPIRRSFNRPAPQSGLARNNDGSAASAQQTRGISRLLLPKRTSPRKRLTLTDSPPAADVNAKAVLDVMGTPSPDKGKRGSPVSKKVRLGFVTFRAIFFGQHKLSTGQA